MTALTKQAIRVYAALAQLKGQGDVLDALIPFFEPIFEKMHGKLYEPQIFAKVIQRLYGWHFTKDIAEELIPRLVRHGMLMRKGTLRSGTYIVCYERKTAVTDNGGNVVELLDKLTTEFAKFSEGLTQAVEVETEPLKLQDMLIRFLVSLNAYSESSLRQQIADLSVDDPVSTLLSGLEEGGQALTHHDRYQCARFVKYIYEERPALISFLGRLASIGLLTEVVEDFIKPSSITASANLDVIIDAPLALHYLGTSGSVMSEDIQNVLDSLKAIGCRLLIFPSSCEEITRVLSAMLYAPVPERHGYTWDAIRRGEITEDFAWSVRRDPETVLKEYGIHIKHIDLTQYPNQHRFFAKDHFESFLGSIGWVQEIAAREHDAICLALTMRLREGHHSADAFKCKFVFVTANPMFAKAARTFCIQNRMIHDNQCGPVIHQRELATLAWLRTGLGGAENIPKSYLLGACDNVLRIRPEVMNEVHSRLKQVTPDRVKEFEILISNHRSVERLMDQTLGDVRVVTSENVAGLLDEMENATAERLEAKIAKILEGKEQEREQFERKRVILEEKHTTELAQKNMEVMRLKASEREFQNRQHVLLHQIVRRNNVFVRNCRWSIDILIFLAFSMGVLGYVYPPMQAFFIWKLLGVIATVLGLYHLIQHLRQRRIIGLGDALIPTCVGRDSRGIELTRWRGI